MRSVSVSEIKRRVDIAALISEHVPLTRSGSGFLGLCPFHQENTPSFRVDPERGLYHCFGCNAGGDAFSFLMQLYGATFREALEALAGPDDIRVLEDDPVGPQVAAAARESAFADIRTWRGELQQRLELARGDIFVREAALRRDPGQHEKLTGDLVAQCADAEKRETDLHEQLDELDALERTLGPRPRLAFDLREALR